VPTLSTLLRRRRAARTAELAQAKVFGRYRLGHERQGSSLSQQASQIVGQSRRRRSQAHSVHGSEDGQPLVPGNLLSWKCRRRMDVSQRNGRAEPREARPASETSHQSSPTTPFSFPCPALIFL